MITIAIFLLHTHSSDTHCTGTPDGTVCHRPVSGIAVPSTASSLPHGACNNPYCISDNDDIA